MNAKVAGSLVALLFSLPGLAQIGGFGGPAVLSRGTRPTGREGARPIYFSGHVSISSTYSTGLTAAATDQRGSLLDDETFGAWIGYGITGNRQGRRDVIFGSYSGGYRLYADDRYYSGASQSLTLSYSRQLSRRWTMFLSQRGSASNTLLDSTTQVSTDELTAELTAPTDEILDTSYLLLSSAAGVSYQKSARMSFSFSTGALFARRHNRSLGSSNGVIGSANMSYMLSRRQQIGVSYTYGTYYLTREFGQTNVMSAQLTYGRTLGPRWFFNAGAGAYHVDSERLTRVPVDPFIFLITGQRDTIEIFRGTRRGLSASAAVAGRFRLASVTLGYARGITPGNGLYLGAERESAGVSVGVATPSRASLSFGADWTRMKAITQTIGNAEGYGARMSTSYRIFSFVHATANAAFRRWQIRATDYSRDRFHASAGLSFGSPQFPLSLW